MARNLASVTILLIVLAVGIIGYVSGSQTMVRNRGVNDNSHVERSVNEFYAALGTLDDDDGMARLEAMLAPDYSEQRLGLQQVLDRDTFLQSVEQEWRTYPERRFVPVSLASDGSWVMAVVNALDSTPGSFAAIVLPPSSRIRREMLQVIDGKIVERIVLEGEDTELRSLPPARVTFEAVGMQTIEVVRREYAPGALERIGLDGPGLIVVETGMLTIGTPGTTISAGNGLRVMATDTLSIENRSDVPASLLVLNIVPIDRPRTIPAQPQRLDAGPGVAAGRIAQSIPFLPEASCFTAESGLAVLAADTRLPRHRNDGHELLIPIAGRFDASSERRPFLRTDSVRSWQDETTFAQIDAGIALAAAPGSWTTFMITGDQPASAWVFAIIVDDRDCPIPDRLE